MTHASQVAFVLCLLGALAPLAADGRQSQVPPASPAGAVEILSVALVDKMDGVAGGTWRPANPDQHAALVIRTRVTRGAEYSTSDFTLGYGPAAKKQRAVCAGVTARIPDGWAVNEKGMEWSFFPGGTGTLDGLGLLFVIPKGLTEATLYHKAKPVGAAFEIKWP